MKKYLTILFCSAVISSPAYSSLTCINDYENNDGCTSSVDTAGDCGSLGYSTAEVSGCKKYLKCPFNSSYKICVAGGAGSVDCAELGFTDDDKTSWCKAEDLITCPGTTLTLCAAPDMVAIAPTCEDLGFTQEEKPWCSSLEKCKYDETYTLCNTALNAKTCAERGFTADDKASWCDENSIVECKEADGTIMTLCSAPLVECPYGSVEACQEANPWGVCNEVDGCAQVTECAEGYVNSGIPPQFTVEDAGTYGNGMHCIRANGCNAELNAYADRAVCTKGISVDPLTLHGITCFVCEEGYEDEEDTDTDTDTDCSKYTLSKCPTSGICGTCKNSSGTHYKLDTCESGYIKLSATATSCTKTYNNCEETGLKSSNALGKCAGSATYYKPSGTPMTCYYGCPDCDYLYDIATYPNVREVKYNDSCVRDGVTYYREVCSGTSEFDCNGCLTTTCVAYNGNDYGTCSPKPAKGCGHEFTFEVTLEHADASVSGNDCRMLFPSTGVVFTASIYKDGNEYASTQVTASGSDFSAALNKANYQNIMPTANFSKNIPNGTYDFYITMQVNGNGSGVGSTVLPDLRKVSAAGTTISGGTMCTRNGTDFNVCNLGSIEVSDSKTPYSVQLLVGPGCGSSTVP